MAVGFLRGFVQASALAAILAGGPSVPAASAQVDFSRDVLPILADNCYHCHGPDEKARKGKLRLDTKEGAFRVKAGKTVIVPGKSGESELALRLSSADPEELMPPPDSKRKLSAAQIDLIKRWVDQGAKWNQHWAFVPPTLPAEPEVKLKSWPRNGIDNFVLARLEKEGLPPSPAASKETLIRRVTLDLTGLPPTLDEVRAFVADQSPDAFERVVDRLLKSPRYGERMASDWLDVARYSDTHGYQMDRYRAMWPWRDWVIKAFNENLPYDQFITWQIGGDLLPNATKEQRLATAFNRHHNQSEEGGIVEEEYRVAYVVDRVNTMGSAFLGLTFECSRCHDHKFDPVSQKDFYSLFAFFQNIDESGQTTYFTEAMPVPTLVLSDDKADAKLAELKAKIAGKEQALAGQRDAAKPAFAAWWKEKTNAFAIPGLVGQFAFDEIVSNKVANLADPAKPARAQENPKLAPGKEGQAADLSGENGFTFPGLGHFSRVDPFSLSLWLQTPAHAPRLVVAHHSKAPIDAGSRGYELLLENGHVSFGLHHMWPRNSLKISSKDPIPTNAWVHVTVTYDGSSRAAGARLFLNGKPAEVTVVKDGLFKDITYGGGEPDLAIGYRFRDNGFKGGRVDDFRVYNRALTPVEAASVVAASYASGPWGQPLEQLTEMQRSKFFDYYLANVHVPSLALAAELRAARAEQSELVNPIPEVMVMEEMATPRPSYVLRRGAYDARGEIVPPNTPAFLPPMAPDQPRNRLGFARWLVDKGNPLTARVTVNRAWQLMFGKGIVETSDNFGSQGQFPTHPELLDWLAGEFVRSGWDMKELLKLIALSSTYRQSSRPTPDLLSRDPGNLLLARAPVRRLTAEMLRDQALDVSGLLAEKLGGPSVKPYQPAGLWEEKAMGAPHYDQGKGADLRRRSLYTYWKRTVPHPAMIAFDAPERNTCTVRRQSTSTPLQALALLNDVQVMESARFLGQRMLKEGGATLDERVGFAFGLATARPPSPKELAVLKALFVEQREIFQQDSAAAAKLLAVGETASDAGLDRADLAAGTVLAEAILNHDEAVNRR